jgi:class 3 adenylate cyclase
MAIERHESTAVLFADISGSMSLYAEVGDDRARAIVAQTLAQWSSLTAAGGGRVIQLRGDAVLATFGTVDDALAAFVRMRDLRYDPLLSMHAGLHVGGMLLEADQLYGDAVNVAARMADIAKRFEIAITATAFESLEEPGRWPELRLIRNVPVKGKREPVDIFLLPSNRQTLTDYRPPLSKQRAALGLTLRYGTQSVIVDGSSGACLMGRDDGCRIKIEHRLVSRRHASIECVSGKFFLQDHSTNGTYVTESGQSAPALLQREICQLKGEGSISLGIEPALNREHLITFAIVRHDSGAARTASA